MAMLEWGGSGGAPQNCYKYDREATIKASAKRVFVGAKSLYS
jgi:hypothetical protein